jgi:hypothetical protein
MVKVANIAFASFFFHFLSRPFSGTRWWISMLGTSKDIVCDKEVPFGGLIE